MIYANWWTPRTRALSHLSASGVTTIGASYGFNLRAFGLWLAVRWFGRGDRELFSQRYTGVRLGPLWMRLSISTP